MFDEADQEVDEWRAREIANDIKQRKSAMESSIPFIEHTQFFIIYFLPLCYLKVNDMDASFLPPILRTPWEKELLHISCP